jgi:uncharacterized membrane protein YfcA
LNRHTAIFLFFAGALGGAINAVAGDGSFVAFPALLFTGVPAVPANVTNTLALWVGTTASGGAYRMRLNIPRRVMIRSCRGDVCDFAGDILAAGAGDDGGIFVGGIHKRTLCAEAAAVVDTGVCDFGWDCHDRLFLCACV